MSLEERIQLGYIIFVGVLLLAGLASVAFTLPKVRPHWKGAYWMAIGLNLTLIAAFGLGAARMLGLSVSGMSVLWALETGLALTAFELILVPYIHRKEQEMPGGPGPG